MNNGSGLLGGYVIQSEALAPLPGFSGAAINMLVIIDLEGNFIDVKLLDHYEPIFVSGLGQAPFHEFMTQYRGHSILTSMVVGTSYGKGDAGSSLIYLDGVTKATASVRIAHESILAAARDVAKTKLKGLVQTTPAAVPNLNYREDLRWNDLVTQGIAKRLVVINQDVQAQFEGTKWADDGNSSGAPSDAFIDLWAVDVGPPSVARGIFKQRTLDELSRLRDVAEYDEPILLIEAGQHGLVSDDFVRNTTPDLVSAEQDGLPLALRDADLLIDLRDEVPDGVAMIVRIDRRLGFDPMSEWNISLDVLRAHGMFQPEYRLASFSLPMKGDERFFDIVEIEEPLPQWLEAINARRLDIVILGVVLSVAIVVMVFQNSFSRSQYYRAFRIGFMVITLGFIGWWGQGQLSVVTPLAVLNTFIEGKNFSFLLYDPFSLLIWCVVVASFFIWGRALFCGWLCPFGAFQEILGKLAWRLNVPQYELPERINAKAVWIKYVLLLGLVLTTLIRPEHIHTGAEIEPFKTAISVFFVRDWYYVVYALLCLSASLFTYKAFCRYMCPLGAVLAIGGLFRQLDFIERRAECGSPCQLCRVKCPYKAITPTGDIVYSECFGCLDCVGILQDDTKCVPRILSAKKRSAA